ncbi:metallophosphoesterase [bacterium]|nr:metallophosphoesterase [bacterium]
MNNKKLFNVVFMILIFLLSAINEVSASVIKFAQISDIHYQPKAPQNEKSFKLKFYALNFLDDAIEQIKKEKNVNFILVTGDAADKPIYEDFDFIYKYLNKNLPCKWYYVLGNHDVSPNGIKKVDQIKILSENGKKEFAKGKTYYSFKPKKDMTFIALDGTYENKVTSQGYIPPEQLNFVDETIAKSKNDAIVIFLHHPITYPAKASDHNVINDFALKEILKKYNNPIMVIGGHFHACKIEQEYNIIEVASPALVSYPNAFRFITIDNKKNKTTFTIDYRETTLKDLQSIAKEKLTWGHKWVYGNSSDRLTTIVVDKRKKN